MLAVWFRVVRLGRSWVRVPSLTAVVVAVVSVLALALSAATADASPVVSRVKVKAAAVDQSPVLVRDDVVSARITARVQKSRVEVLSARTEVSQTFVNPDGSFTTEVATGPVREQLADGSWAGLDLDLVTASSGGLSPKVSPVPVVFSGGGSGALATAKIGARSVSVDWPMAGQVPAPTVVGNVATYAVSAGEDVVLTATRSGFEESVVLKSRPTSAVSLSLPVSGSGLSMAADSAGGGFTFAATSASGSGTAKVAVGDPVVAVPAPVMFSAATDASTGLATQVQALDAKLGAGPGGKGQALNVTADAGFLSDPGTVYPVTIDPVIASVPEFGDTWVQNGLSTPQWQSPYEPIGLQAAATRSLIRFDMTSLIGTHVTAASLRLWQHVGNTCATKTTYAYPITDEYTNTSVVWSNQPAVNTSTTYRGSATFNNGFDDVNCPRGFGSIDVTSMVNGWASGAIPSHGLELQAFSETDSSYAKSFCSFDSPASGTCAATDRVPTLSVTYNSYPQAPTASTVAMHPQVNGTTGKLYATSLNPTLQAKVGNSDGGLVSLQGEVSFDPAYTDGTGVVWTGTGTPVAPLSTATVQVSPALTATYHYRYRVRGSVPNGAGGTDYGPWSGYTSFVENTALPGAPTVTCASYPSGTWTASTGGSVSCSLSTTATDGAGYYWGLDDPTLANLQDNGTNNGATQSITINPAEGYHTLYARTRDTALQQSATTTKYAFGVGNGGLLTPAANTQTQKAVALTAQSSTARTQVTYQYQAGTGGSTWTTIPTGNVTVAGTGGAVTWPQAGTTSGSLVTYAQLNWDVAATLAAASAPDGAVQVRACFTQAGANQWCSAGTTFTETKTAFAGASATTDLGPGTVSLVTGDLAVDENDVSMGDFSIGRTNTNLAPPAATTGPSGAFGAGWSTSAFGADAGAGDDTLNDNSANGSVTLVDSSGTKETYIKNGTTYKGVADAADGSVLAKVGATWQLSDTDGTVTTWKLLSGSTYVTSSVQQPGTEGLTVYAQNGTGQVTQIVAPAPTSITCTTANAATTRGCRSLTISYASSTTATGTTEATWGNYTGLVTQIAYTAWDPATSAMFTTTVASYLYDNIGHLRAEWDPRISPALKTRYTYDTNGRLATETDPGRAAWTMTYDTGGRLVSVSRPDPANGTATQAVVYGIALSGSGLPDVTAATAATWNQITDQAYAGAAVFPASHVPPTTSGAYTPGASDWPYADLTYVDVNGREVNSASYGAGAWRIDTTRYDDSGNTVWSLTARNRAQALVPIDDTDPYTASQSSSALRADLLSTTSTYTPDGADELTELAPARPLYLTSGAYASVRVKTTNTYDQGSPGGATYHLITTTKTAPAPLDGTATTAADTSTVTTGYDPIDGQSSTGNTSGWTQRAPTLTTTIMGTTPGAADILKKVKYDSSGRAVESRMPESTGADAGTTISTYYTADASSPVTGCRSKPEWAGLLCQSGPQTQPPGSTIPVTTSTYDKWDNPLIVTQTSGGTTRVTTKTYDTGGRPSTTALVVTPASDGGTAVPTVTTGYDPSTGDATTVTNGTTTLTTGYNSIGEVTSYTDADSQNTISTYTIDGQPATLNDGKGTYAYTYDGTDAAGKTEHRGLLTGLDVGLAAGQTNFKAAYDQDGQLVEQDYPNGLQQFQYYNNTGDQISESYSKSGTEWMQFDADTNRDGNITWQSGPASTQFYGYDNNDRLTNVQDIYLGQCTTRGYTFSKNGNRTALTTGAPAADGTCQTSTTTTVNTTYDTADRDTNTGYTYDKFGRTLTVPSADVTGGAALSTGYYANDMVATLTQGSTAKTFTLDPSMRLRQATDTTSGTETRRILNHYNDSGDTPSWINTSTDAGTTWTWQRNIAGIDGDLAILQNQTGTPQIQLTNPHGDVIATVDDTTAATGPNATFENTEYGAPRPQNTTNPARYGWLGGKQRSDDALGGLTLMGVRLYNPSTGRFLSGDPVDGVTKTATITPTTRSTRSTPVASTACTSSACVSGLAGGRLI